MIQHGRDQTRSLEFVEILTRIVMAETRFKHQYLP